jgi:hypothetical protein
MDNQEAKFILRAYRPGGADASNPAFAEALEQARKDPSLSDWLQREQALDRAVAEKLRARTPPAGLREAILTGAKMSAPRKVWWHRPGWIGLAASFFVVFGLAFLWPRSESQVDFERLASLAIDDALHGHTGEPNDSVHGIQASLSDPSLGLASERVRPVVAEMRRTSCRTLRIAGKDFAEICFSRNGQDFHFYVGAPGRTPLNPRYVNREGAVAAVWGDTRHSYVLATTGSLDSLKAVL